MPAPPREPATPAMNGRRPRWVFQGVRVRALRSAIVLAVAVAASPPAAAQGPLSAEERDRRLRELAGPDAAARAAAAEVLGRRGAPHRAAITGPLRERLRADPDWRVRASSGRALGRLSSRAAVPDLVRALRDPRVDVRVVAAARSGGSPTRRRSRR